MSSVCCCCNPAISSSGEEVEDDDAVGLSHVGEAAYEVLRKKHNRFHHQLWNVTSGRVVGDLHQTPVHAWRDTTDLPESGHDDWFPQKLQEIIERTEIWCDVLTLGPPDGLFMQHFHDALVTLAEKAQSKTITLRIMFGNIVGMPVNITAVTQKLTKSIDVTNTKLQLWVGAWRKGVSWNHAKIIAVDGRFLWTGGHNVWDYHYLKHDPVHDLSLELEGRVAHDGHLYANAQWDFVQFIQSTVCGYCVDKLPDGMPLIATTRVTVSEFPPNKVGIFPPRYHKHLVPKIPYRSQVPIISMGRYGAMVFKKRPSDDAFLAMLDSSKKIIRMALQDLGPVCIPGTKITLPGCEWPKPYLETLGRVIWERGVDVEIVLSNPGSIPGGLKPTEAQYGNGWSCVDVAAEIIKTIKKQFPDADEKELRKKVEENLRVCFLRQKRGNKWNDGMGLALHSKHFIIDDVACYIGSQNLYVCDLAEWGILIDNEEQTQAFMKEYWEPMWTFSYTGEDCNVQDVMDGLKIDRDAENRFEMSDETKQKLEEAAQTSGMTAEQMAAGGGVVVGQGRYYYQSEEAAKKAVNKPIKVAHGTAEYYADSDEEGVNITL